ncbi:MAG: PIN domain-containing protein [Limnohabitans sp.]
MLAFISDANILIDVEVGGLLAPMFSLGYQFAVPDVLYFEELAEHHAHWRDMGLIVKSLPAEGVDRVQALSQKYKRPSRNDLFALALAEQAQCPLLTGDAALRSAAETEKIEVKGTIWVVTEMVRQQCITATVARVAYKAMQEQGRRLPWELAENMLKKMEG